MSIELRNVSYIYAGKTQLQVKALSEVSLKIENGEFIGIAGETGCGKSTLIQLIAGLLTPSTGQVIIDGQDINNGEYDRTILRNTVGIVFQNPEYQLFETTVEKDVAFVLKHKGLNKEQITQRVKWALEVTGFNYELIRKKSPLALSGGEKRKVAIAGVLAARPKILIFDEPIAGLDPIARAEFLELIKRLNASGTTIIMVSHNLDALCEYAKRIVVLCKGQVVRDGTPEQIFDNLAEVEKVNLSVGSVRGIAESLYNKGVISSPLFTKKEELIRGIKSALKVGDTT